jgi:hypothetical protein
MGDQYEYMEQGLTLLACCQERPITSLQIVLQVSGDPITPFLLRLPRDRSPPIERLHGGGRGAAVTRSGEEGGAYCLLDLAARFSNSQLVHPSTCVHPQYWWPLWSHSPSVLGSHHQCCLSLFATLILASGFQTSARTNHGPIGQCSGLASQSAFRCLLACQHPLQYTLFWAGLKTHCQSTRMSHHPNNQ